jgi:hypothetical protein
MISNFLQQRQQPSVFEADVYEHEHRARTIEVYFNNCVITTVYCADCDARLKWYIENLEYETSPIGVTDNTQIS